MAHRIGTSWCQQCGTAFEHRIRADREIKFCSQQCSADARRKDRPGNLQEMDCEQCGKPFRFRPTKSTTARRYCSRKCFNAGYSATARAARTKPCAACGKPFVPTVRTVVYCSRACVVAGAPRVVMQKRPCLICEKTYQPTSNRQRWCVECSGDKAGRARLTRYGVSAPQWEQMVARFDGACWICRVNPAAVVDHCHATNRVRGALCQICNMVLHYVERPGWWDDAKSYLNGGDEHCGTEVQLP